MNSSKASKIIFGYFLIVALWWLVLFLLNIKYSFQNYLYQFGFGLIPLVGGVSGIFKSKKWGFLKSQVGAAVLFTSLGLISWGIGQMIWSYYNVVYGVEVPYPSWADAGYILAIPLWALGIINLSKATGAKFSLRNTAGKTFMFIFPIIAVIFSYYLLIVVARGGEIDFGGGALKLFFDLAYPLGDVVILTFSLIIYGLSVNYLGGKYKWPIVTTIVGFVVMYFTDFTFSYVTTTEAYYNGHWVDLLFPTAMAIIAIGVNNLDTDLGKEV